MGRSVVGPGSGALLYLAELYKRDVFIKVEHSFKTSYRPGSITLPAVLIKMAAISLFILMAGGTNFVCIEVTWKTTQ